MKLIIFILFLIFSNTVFCQYDSKGQDEISRFRPGMFWFYNGMRPSKEQKIRKYDRLIFDLFYNDWTGDQKPFKVKPTSIGFGINLLFDVPITKGNTFALGWGIHYSYSHVQHNNTLLTNQNENWTKYTLSPLNVNSSFNYNQFSIPLELRFRNESWKHFKLHLGGKFGYIVGANEKTILKDPTGKTVLKDSHFPDLQRLQYSAHVRIGLRNLSVFGEYNFSPLFSNAQSTRLNVLRIGLSVSLF